MSSNSRHHADFGRDFDDQLGIHIPEPEQSTDPLDIATAAMRDAVAMLGESTDDFDRHLAVQQPRRRFTPGYEQAESTRVLRVRIEPDEHGVDRIRFKGAVRSAWIATSPGSGRGSVYAEVDTSADFDTLMGVAVIPTGKRVPKGASRMGSAGSAHFYLLGTTQVRTTVLEIAASSETASDGASPAPAEDGEG